ncbi:MAG: nucleoside-diphosphate kinase [Bacteroidia bacterium]|nr:nucleoside-diphosphate kinase [Bacteroidia bacterium]MDW8302037.1 nucleoside-diphosphate kinase [Bacteroidia bacterium]
MATNRTLSIIKPDAVSAGNAGKIIDEILQAGFKIVAMKLVRLSTEQAAKFYEVHKERPFYKDLVNFMSSGPIIPMILEKENAVADFRKLIGATNPAQAEEGTIRKKYATNVERNAIHGSDSDENALIESRFFFASIEEI